MIACFFSIKTSPLFRRGYKFSHDKTNAFNGSIVFLSGYRLIVHPEQSNGEGLIVTAVKFRKDNVLVFSEHQNAVLNDNGRALTDGHRFQVRVCVEVLRIPNVMLVFFGCVGEFLAKIVG